MTNLEPCQPVACLVLVLPAGDSQARKEDDAVAVVGSKKVAEQHEEGIKRNSLDNFYPARQIDIAVREADGDKREDRVDG